MVLGSALVVVFLLLVGFILLTRAESRAGKRVAEPLRAGLDRAVARVTKGGGTVLAHSVYAGGTYVLRHTVHGILVSVRTVERALTRAARALRSQEASLERSRMIVMTRVKRLFGKREKDATTDNTTVQ